EDGGAHDERGNPRGHERGRRDVEAEVALLEDDRPVGEERLEQLFEHRQLLLDSDVWLQASGTSSRSPKPVAWSPLEAEIIVSLRHRIQQDVDPQRVAGRRKKAGIFAVLALPFKR